MLKDQYFVTCDSADIEDLGVAPDCQKTGPIRGLGSYAESAAIDKGWAIARGTVRRPTERYVGSDGHVCPACLKHNGGAT